MSGTSAQKKVPVAPPTEERKMSLKEKIAEAEKKGPVSGGMGGLEYVRPKKKKTAVGG